MAHFFLSFLSSRLVINSKIRYRIRNEMLDEKTTGFSATLKFLKTEEKSMVFGGQKNSVPIYEGER